VWEKRKKSGTIKEGKKCEGNNERNKCGGKERKM